MNISRIVIAFLLAIGLLYIAGANSRGRSEEIVWSENGYTFELITVPKAIEQTVARISVRITGPLDDALRPVFRSTTSGQRKVTKLARYSSRPMLASDSIPDLYYVDINVGDRGDRMYYYFEIRDAVGGRRAWFTSDERTPFFLKYIGDVPGWLIGGHIFFFFAAAFWIFLSAMLGLKVISTGTNVHSLLLAVAAATICVFIGGYPLGIMMNGSAFGTTWEGVPFGTDATDNKTQLLFIYLLFVLLAGIGSLTRKKLGHDIYSGKTLGWFALGGLIMMLATHIIPHSIQFSPVLTRSVCWSFISVIALLYIIGWLKYLRRFTLPTKKHFSE